MYVSPKGYIVSLGGLFELRVSNAGNPGNIGPVHERRRGRSLRMGERRTGATRERTLTQSG